MSRPKIIFDEKAIADYARRGASNRRIADILGVDEGTIRKRFSALLRKTRGERELELQDLQMKAARNLNPALLIWLGKQDLGQVDRQESKNEDTVIFRDETKTETRRRLE